MESIAFPIAPGASCPPITNLQDALLSLLSRGALRALPDGNRPTAAGLEALIEGLRRELGASLSGETTTTVVEDLKRHLPQRMTAENLHRVPGAGSRNPDSEMDGHG
jgi:hypothetical protein